MSISNPISGPKPQLREKTLAFPLHACTGEEEEFPGWLILIHSDDTIPRCLTLAGALSSHQPSLSPAVHLQCPCPLRTASCSSLLTKCRSQAFAPLALPCSSYPNTPLSQQENPASPCTLIPCPSASSAPSQPFSSQLRSLSQLQPSATEWELHKNTNLLLSNLPPHSTPLPGFGLLPCTSEILACPTAASFHLSLKFIMVLEHSQRHFLS